MSVNWVDAAILLTIFWFGFTGLASGLLRTGVTLLSFLLGVLLAGIFYPRLANDVRVMISDEATVRIISISAIFIATALGGQLLAIVLKQAASVFFFGPLDGVGGLVLGLAKALIIIELMLIVAIQFRGQSTIVSDSLTHSVLVPYLLRDFNLPARMLPPEVRSTVDQFTNSLH